MSSYNNQHDNYDNISKLATEQVNNNPDLFRFAFDIELHDQYSSDDMLDMDVYIYRLTSKGYHELLLLQNHTEYFTSNYNRPPYPLSNNQMLTSIRYEWHSRLIDRILFRYKKEFVLLAMKMVPTNEPFNSYRLSDDERQRYKKVLTEMKTALRNHDKKWALFHCQDPSHTVKVCCRRIMRGDYIILKPLAPAKWYKS